MRANRTDIEAIIERVNGSMAMDGMPLSNDDKARIRKYGGNPIRHNEIKRELIKKHTANTGPLNMQEPDYVHE